MASVEDLLKQGQRDLNLGNPKDAMISFEFDIPASTAPITDSDLFLLTLFIEE